MTRGGGSWLSFAKNPATKSNKEALRALKGESRFDNQERRSTYSGKTYNSTDAIAEFFKQKKSDSGSNQPNQKPGSGGFSFGNKQSIQRPPSVPPKPQGKADKLQNQAGFLPGMHVKHPKYGKGLVLRREGSGDDVKLTISFPGFGQKKLIEKFANLEKA
jgi:DNA helicase-2/ATP-dependent DNA helicase PcrA